MFLSEENYYLIHFTFLSSGLESIVQMLDDWPDFRFGIWNVGLPFAKSNAESN